MSSSVELIAEKFYTAFQQKDAEGMNQNYHRDLQFEDPAFGKLDFQQTCSMWKMLCEGATDLTINFEILRAEDKYIETRWLAEYTFTKTKKFVRNEIIAQMHFKDSKIIRHTDNFDLYKWAKQAIGLQGWLIGSTAFFKKKLQQTTKRQLTKYMQRGKN